MRTGNYDLTAHHFLWIDESLIAEETHPEWGTVVERLSWGRFYGLPKALLIDGRRSLPRPKRSGRGTSEFHPQARARYGERVRLAKHELGAVNRRKNAARLKVVAAGLSHGKDSPEHAAAEQEQARVGEWRGCRERRESPPRSRR